MKIKILFFLCVFAACDEEKERVGDTKPDPKPVVETEPPVDIPDFNADSAYHYIETQVDFGPRVPNTESHRQTGDFLIATLERFGLEVTVQETQVVAFNNAKLNIRNIIASHQPQLTTRILLFAHWDTRPFADQDSQNKNVPIPGANDGGSGTGVLLEIARILGEKPANIGVDIILFDAEDYGQPENTMLERKSDTYCLGSQYWSRNPHTPGYKARFGILLDMVGARGAVFTKEGTSMYYAPGIVEKVWQIAARSGYGAYFQNRQTDPITDDHYYVNSIAGIPSIDIIEFDANTPSQFGPYWHTHKDDMDIIDKATLKAVGQTVTEVVYREK